MQHYDTWSLAELKTAFRDAAARLPAIERLHQAFALGSHDLAHIGEDLNSATATVMTGWQGTASEAAHGAMLKVVEHSEQSHEASYQYATATRELGRATRRHTERGESIEEVDTSWGASARSAGYHPAATVADHHNRVQRAEANRARAAQEASELDAKGHEYHSMMKSASWPQERDGEQGANPPRSLPPRQATTTSTPPSGPASATTPATAASQREAAGPRVTAPPGPATTRAPGALDLPTLPAAVTTKSTAGSATGAVGEDTAGSGYAGVPGAAAGAGGIGAEAGGSAGWLSRAGAGAGDGVAARPGPAAGAPSEDLASGSGSPTAARGAAAAVAGEEGAGRGGMYAPMGAAGGARRDDDEDSRRPDYLEEVDDPWGLGGQVAVRPVLGED